MTIAYSLSPVADPCGHFVAVHVGSDHVLSIVDSESGDGLDLVLSVGSFVYLFESTLADTLADLPSILAASDREGA